MRHAITESLSYLVRGTLACVCLGLTSLTDALASVDICQDPSTYSRLSVDIVRYSDSTFANGAGTVGQKNNNFDLMFKTDDDKWLFGAGHRYTIFDIDPLQPATNGHLHTFFLPLHKLTENDRRSFRFSIAPALSALVWGRRLSDRMSLRYGICGDHRFGDYQIYPLISVQWQLHPDWNVQLGFPASQLTYRISKRSRSMIRLRPDGNEWYVLDKSLVNHSQFVYESYALEWTFDWELRESFAISASVGRQFHNRFEMTLLDRSRVRLSGNSVTRVGAALEWRF